MRGAWIVAVVIALGLVAAGFFAQGMSRLAGLPAGSPKSLPAVSTATAATENSRPNTAAAAPAAQAPVATAAPVESRMLQAIASAPDAAVEPAAPAPQAPAPLALMKAAPARAAAAPIQPVAIPTTLSPEERRAAQCRSLRAWLGEIDSIARARTDAETQAWVQAQRATTREREAELRC